MMQERVYEIGPEHFLDETMKKRLTSITLRTIKGSRIVLEILKRMVKGSVVGRAAYFTKANDLATQIVTGVLPIHQYTTTCLCFLIYQYLLRQV